MNETSNIHKRGIHGENKLWLIEETEKSVSLNQEPKQLNQDKKQINTQTNN